MVNKIAEFFETRKGHDALLVVTVVLLGVVSFGLGRLSVGTTEVQPVMVYMASSTPAYAAAPGVAQSERAVLAPQAASADGKQYVASKNGTVYHLPWCAGAQRIKEENKIWFTSKEEAEAAGLRPAANCKGI